MAAKITLVAILIFSMVIPCFSAGISMQHPIPQHPQQRDGDTWRQHCQPDFPVSVQV